MFICHSPYSHREPVCYLCVFVTPSPCPRLYCKALRAFKDLLQKNILDYCYYVDDIDVACLKDWKTVGEDGQVH